MNTQLNTAYAKLKRGSEHYLNGKPVYVERDKCDGTVLICNSSERLPGDNYWTVLKSELQTMPKFNSTLSVVSKKETSEQVSDKAALNAFFKVMAELVPFKCMNCGKFMFAVNKAAIRAVTCHILAKSKFPELATDPDNIVFMGVYAFGSECDDHSRFDYSVDNRVKMPIYPIVLKRYYEKLRDKLSPEKQVLADEYLGITQKSNNLAKSIADGKLGGGVA